MPFPSPGFFLTQGSNLCLLHYRQIFLPLSHLGKRVEETSICTKSGPQCPLVINQNIVRVSRSAVPHSAIPWTAALQAPLSMRFSRQGYWSGLPFPSPGDLPNPGIKPGSPALQTDSLPTELQGKPHQNIMGT